MGTEYTFVCEDCKKYYDIGKDTNAICLMPILLKEHEGHNVLVFSEHETGLEFKYKGSNYPNKNIETGYAEEMVWDENGLVDKFKRSVIPDWDYRDFYNWYYNQDWYINNYPHLILGTRKEYTPEEWAERQERTAKSVQKFYETLDDDMEKWYLPDSEKDNILSYDPKDWTPIVGHAVNLFEIDHKDLSSSSNLAYAQLSPENIKKCIDKIKNMQDEEKITK